MARQLNVRTPLLGELSAMASLDAPRVLLVREERFLATPDGGIWSRWGTGQATWTPYLEVFGQVEAIARIQPVGTAEPGWTRSDHPGVSFHASPYFDDVLSYLRVRSQLKAFLVDRINRQAPLILRVPSPLANSLKQKLASRPYALEVAGDPYDQMAPGAMRHPFRPLIRESYRRSQEQLCRAATAIKYVTAAALQARYRPGDQTRVFSVSDVQLPPEAFAAERRTYSVAPLRIVCVGMMEQLYKGQDILLRAVAEVKSGGHPVTITLVGDGRYRSQLERLARELGIGGESTFTGVLDNGGIRRTLDNSDLFVLASRQEGMPRAMLEAMARSLPCVGTRVGGIPELLPPAHLVTPERPAELARCIRTFYADPASLARAARRDYSIAVGYRLDVLRRLEREFLATVAATCGRPA